MIRSILAVTAGIAIWTVLWFAGNSALLAIFTNQPTAEGHYDNPAMLGLLLAVSILCSLASGFVCRKVTKSANQTPVLTLAGLLLLTGLGVQIPIWASMPVWFHIPFLLLLIPCALFGAKLAANKPA